MPQFPFLKQSLSVVISSMTLTLAHAQTQEEGAFYDEVTILGNQESAIRLTGSGHFISPEQLKEFSYTDIQRIVREVPGVSIQVEDGYGLRPNISIRGVATERSGRITLLEDNVLIAPAPYAAPAAYYFPTVGRMHALEVVKGPAAITQGPYTIGGAVNMVSTPIPAEMGGDLLVEAGQNASYRVHANYGGYSESGFGFLLETHQWQSEGFQDIDRSSNDSGLDVEDYTLKLAYAPMDSRHKVELKLQYAEQDSNQSYLGLSDADFAATPYRRYGLSALDNIATEHEQAILRYEFAVNGDLSFKATAYNNEHARNWYKTEGIDLDGSLDADSLSRTSWANIIDDINLGRSRNGFSPAQLEAILHGELDTPSGSIDVRANNREYYSRGVQLGLAWNANIGASTHQLEASVRFHRDAEDRLQYDSSYQQVGGLLQLNDVGALGAAGNRLSKAEAMAFYIYDNIEMGNWIISPGLRYEDIELERTDYNGGAARTFRSSRDNDVQVWLPGLGVNYRLNDEMTLVAGVHKGFTAPTNAAGVDGEEALNYEFGFRYQSAGLNADLMGFYSDYENLLGVCTASSGADCVIGDAFNGDAVTVRGLEFMVNAELSSSPDYRLPLTLTYTYINGEFDTDIADTEFFGDVSAGDPLPYIPENQLRASLGFVKPLWGLMLSANYVDSVCVIAACGPFKETDASLILDLSANYQLNERPNLYGRIENLSSQEDIMGRQPYGARPYKDRTATVGLRLDF